MEVVVVPPIAVTAAAFVPCSYTSIYALCITKFIKTGLPSMIFSAMLVKFTQSGADIVSRLISLSELTEEVSALFELLSYLSTSDGILAGFSSFLTVSTVSTVS